MLISTNIEFVKYFAKEHNFFAVKDNLYLIYDDVVVVFDSTRAKHLVNVDYQNRVNKLAPSNNFLIENIKSRVLSHNIPVYDKIHQRIMNSDNGIVYDLIEDGKLALINNDGYQIISKYTSDYLNLISGRYAKPLPLPSKSDKELIDLIGKFTNFSSNNDLILFTVWLVSLCFPNISSPVMILLGEQGSGKSYTSDFVKSIIDPSEVGKQHAVKSVQDFALLVSKSYISIIDNLSQISDDISDAMCQTVSKGQFTTRKLYTSDEIVTIDMNAKLIINGISIMNTKPDLLERSIVITLDKINSSNIVSEEKLANEFNTLLPQILDKIFITISKTLKIVDSVTLPNSPRMADFTQYAVAIATVIGIKQKDILNIYQENIKNVNDIIIDDPVIQALMRILDRNDNYFKGSATTLLELMHTTGITGLPKAANSLSSKITRLTSDLAKESITITKAKDFEGNRSIEIVRPRRSDDLF